MERSQRPSSAKRRAQLNSPTLALYWEIASKQRDAADESSEEDEDAPEQPAAGTPSSCRCCPSALLPVLPVCQLSCNCCLSAGTTSLPMARRKSSLDQSDSPILHTLPGVDHVRRTLAGRLPPRNGHGASVHPHLFSMVADRCRFPTPLKMSMA